MKPDHCSPVLTAGLAQVLHLPVFEHDHTSTMNMASLQNIKSNPNRSSHRLVACHLRRAGSQCWPSPPNSLAGSTLGATGSWGGNPEQHHHRHHFLYCDSHDHQAIMACSRILKTTVWATTQRQTNNCNLLCQPIISPFWLFGWCGILQNWTSS